MKESKPVVKDQSNKETGKTDTKHTLLATIRGDEARALYERNEDHGLYWVYDTKKNTVAIIDDEKMTTPAGLMAGPKPSFLTISQAIT